MNKIKRFLIGLLCAVSVSALALGFSACEDEKPSGEVPSIGGGFGGLGGGSSDDDDDNNNENNQGGNSDGLTHQHEYTSFVTAPTCTARGFTTYTCVCGNNYIGNYVNALNHEFTNYISDSNATYEADGTKTAICNRDGCGETDTVIDENTMLESGLAFKTFTVNETNVTCTAFSNSTMEFSFKDEIETYGNATYEVANDIYGLNTYLTKVVPLSTGDNIFYVFEVVGDEMTTYTVTIRRKPTYTVSFQTNGGDNVDSQTVEEGAFAVQPEDLTKAGYDFDGWDFDFTTPITGDETVCAQWTAHADTPYKVEYYLENLNDNGYTLHQTENLTGTTDEMATAEIKTYPHFTYDSGASNESGYILGDGTQVFKVYYDRNRYAVTLNAINDKGNVTGSGTYANAEEVTASATFNQGYSFDGWYNGNEKVSGNAEYTFNPVSNINLMAKWTANTDTPYKVEHYLENLANDGFTLYETENLTGMTDETATAGINQYEHFTYNKYKYDYMTFGTILGDGTQVLKVYYERNQYTLSSTGNGSITNAGEYKYGTEITSMATHNLGYEIGWYSGEEKISSEMEYVFKIDKDVTARFTVREDMQAFDFTSTQTTCEITELADQTVSQIVIPDYVTTIGAWAFADCDSLTSVTIGNSVTTIGDWAFAWCDNLTSVVISESVTTLGGVVFAGCSKLSVYYAGGIADWCAIEFAWGGAIFDGIDLYIANQKVVNLVIPDDVTKIGNGAFYGVSSLESVIIPDALIIMGYCVFENCDNLNYNVKDGLRYLGSADNPYMYLVGVTDKTINNITIDNNCKFIGDYAFYGCSNLIRVTIPNDITDIGVGAFLSCEKLTNVTFEDTSTWYYEYNYKGERGTQVDVSDSTTVADLLATYDYVWYKL